METQILDGKQLAIEKNQALQNAIQQLAPHLPTPHLAVIVVGQNPASHIYVNKKQHTAKALGIKSTRLDLEATISEQELHDTIASLNEDDSVHGILVQLPLPKHINTHDILTAISPDKDVDGFHPFNLGSLAQNNCQLRPCTPYGIMQLLEAYHHTVSGLHAVVIGTSTIVGTPMGLELMHAGATVTMCHSKTLQLTKHTQQADLLISAVGKPFFIKANMVKPQTIVIDVGITRLDSGKIVGDIDFDSVKHVCKAITPVPGGVGPMTVTTLLQNTYQAYCRQLGLPDFKV